MAKEVKDSSQEYWSYVKRQFKKNKRAVYAAYLVSIMLFIAIFADFIANEKPIVAKYKGSIYFPVFKDYGVSFGLTEWPEELKNIRWKDAKFDWAIRAPIPYSPTTVDLYNSQYKGPFEEQSISSLRWKHWLGTEKIGRDILSSLIHGTRIAFTVGLVSMSIATFIGIILGSLAGFFGDNRLKMSRSSMISSIIFFVLAYFVAFSARGYILTDALQTSIFSFIIQLLLSLLIFCLVLVVGWLVAKPFKLIPFLAKKVYIPIDIIVQRLIEFLVSIPRMFLIIAIVAVAKPSIFMVMAIIGLTSWTEIARFIRAELLKIRSLEYIEASEALGYPNMRILIKHAIPNALSPVLITIAFGIAAAILIESFLSFIGVGIPPEILTWGKLLSEARTAPSAWWLAIFPGFAIFITVTMFNLIGEGLTDALDPRQKR